MVTIVILDKLLFWLTYATARDSMLYPLPEKRPTTLDKTLASLSTQTTIMFVSNLLCLTGALYADLDFGI